MRLYINIDHVATIRQARRTDEPDPVAAALACEAGGADGITVHLREDRRHIQDDDVRRLAQAVTTVLNLELATSDEILALATELRPFQATLVPERREEITTEGGLALSGPPAQLRRLEGAIERLTDVGTRVSLFIDPDHQSIARSAELGVPAVELHTGRYANTYSDSADALEQLQRAASEARQRGLAVHAGHGLTYRNVHPVAAIRDLEELNIGHSIVSRSVFVGMESATREMAELVRSSRPSR